MQSQKLSGWFSTPTLCYKIFVKVFLLGSCLLFNLVLTIALPTFSFLFSRCFKRNHWHRLFYRMVVQNLFLQQIHRRKEDGVKGCSQVLEPLIWQVGLSLFLIIFLSPPLLLFALRPLADTNNLQDGSRCFGRFLNQSLQLLILCPSNPSKAAVWCIPDVDQLCDPRHCRYHENSKTPHKTWNGWDFSVGSRPFQKQKCIRVRAVHWSSNNGYSVSSNLFE